MFVTKPITLIIPTLQPGRYASSFAHAIQELKKSFSALQVIVIDSESDENQISVFKSHADLFLKIKRSEFNHGKTRNIAARSATGEILVFMTQDALLEHPRSLHALVEPLCVNSHYAVVYGRQCARAEAGPIEKLSRDINYPEHSLDKKFDPKFPQDATLKTFFSSNVFAAYRTKTFWEVGGFPEDVILNEDMIINYKLMSRGYVCRYEAQAAVTHSHDYTLKQQFTRYFDIGASLRDHASFFGGIKQSGEGLRFAFLMFSHLLRHRYWGAASYAPFDIAARWLGFKLGYHHLWLPRVVKKKLSMHHYHWDQTRLSRDL